MPPRRSTRASISSPSTNPTALPPPPTPGRTTQRAAAARAARNIDLQIESSSESEVESEDDDEDAADEGNGDEEEEGDEDEDEGEDDNDEESTAQTKARKGRRATRNLVVATPVTEDEPSAPPSDDDIQPKASTTSHRRTAKSRLIEEDDVDPSPTPDNEDLEDAPQPAKRRVKGKAQAISASTSSSSVKPKQPLKIKLKLGGGGGAASSSNGTPVDGEEPTPPSLPSVNLKLGSRGKASSTKKAPTARIVKPSTSKRQVESEDEVGVEAGEGEEEDAEGEDQEEEEEEDVESEDEETSGSGTPAGGKPKPRLTARQAVLASVVDADHIALEGHTLSTGGNTSRRKQPLSEMELALKREETARKRKNLSEKKAEDERNDTINRLLKKQTRPRARRANTGNVPLMGASTPRTGPAVGKSALGGKPATNEDGDEDVEGEDEDEEMGDVAVEDDLPKPTMYRWVSRIESTPTGSSPGEGDMAVSGGQEGERKMVITFSVPESLLPPGSVALRETSAMNVDPTTTSNPPLPPSSLTQPSTSTSVAGKGPGTCAIQGCGGVRKYRFVKDWTVGACGIGHLKDLEGVWRARQGSVGTM